MPIHLRALVGVIAGVLVSVVLAYLAAIVLLVAAIGLPLGSSGDGLGPGEYLGLLFAAGAAAAIGGHIAAGIAGPYSTAVVIAAAACLAGGALWGFSEPGSQWPAWWAPVLAGVAAVGTWLGGTIRGSRNDDAR